MAQWNLVGWGCDVVQGGDSEGEDAYGVWVT